MLWARFMTPNAIFLKNEKINKRLRLIKFLFPDGMICLLFRTLIKAGWIFRSYWMFAAVSIEKGKKNVPCSVGEAGSSSLPTMRYMIKTGWRKIKIGEKVMWFASMIVYLRMSKLHFSWPNLHFLVCNWKKLV